MLVIGDVTLDTSVAYWASDIDVHPYNLPAET